MKTGEYFPAKFRGAYPVESYHEEPTLNSDDTQVRFSARNTLNLHMEKRKAPVIANQHSFAGYETDNQGRVLKKSKVNWPKSDFIELNELCIRLDLKMEFDGVCYKVVLTEDEIELASSDPKQLYSMLKQRALKNDENYWHSLRNQGRIARDGMPHADMSVSNQHLKNLDLSDKLVEFVIKGRLQILETQAMLSTYYPRVHENACPACGFRPDTTSHILCNCPVFRGMYIERHDRTVDLIHQQLSRLPGRHFQNKIIDGSLFNAETFNIPHNKPDIAIINDSAKHAYIIEISNPFDAFINECYDLKFSKYTPLCNSIQNIDYRCTVIVLIIGCLGLVHKRCVKGLQILGMSKARAKALAKYISVSAMIGSRRIWRRRRR